MTPTEIGQTVAESLGLIHGVVCKTLNKYGAKLCQEDIEDIQSNTTLCLLDGRMDNYVPTNKKNLHQWIGYIAMQRCIDYLRALKRDEPLDQGGDDNALSKFTHPADNPEVSYLKKEQRARLRAAVTSLTQEGQQTFAMIVADNCTTRDYAQQLGIKESTAYTRRHRLIKNLRKIV